MLFAGLVLMASLDVTLTPRKCRFGRINVPVVQIDARPVKPAMRVATLKRGAALFVCEAKAGWFGVSFGTPDRPCPVPASGLSAGLASLCQSGWVRQSAVTVLSE